MFYQSQSHCVYLQISSTSFVGNPPLRMQNLDKSTPLGYMVRLYFVCFHYLSCSIGAEH